MIKLHCIHTWSAQRINKILYKKECLSIKQIFAFFRFFMQRNTDMIFTGKCYKYISSYLSYETLKG